MAISLATLRSQVRDMADLDETDLSDSVIDQYAREGFQRIYALERRWPILQETYTLTTVANQREYTISAIGDIREIISVVNTNKAGTRLSLTDYNDAEALWSGSSDVASEPLYYTFWDKKLQLWPKPDAVYTLTVRAFRNPVYTWLTTTSESIDLDEWFHAILPYFVLARVYQRQEDVELSSIHMRSFEEGVAFARRDLMKASSSQPVVMSRGRKYPTLERWLQMLGRI